MTFYSDIATVFTAALNPSAFPFGMTDPNEPVYDEWDDQVVLGRAWCLAGGIVHPPAVGGFEPRPTNFSEINGTLFIGGLRGQFHLGEIVRIAKCFGPVVDGNILTGGNAAIIRFQHMWDAERALSHLQALRWRGQCLRINYANRKDPAPVAPVAPVAPAAPVAPFASIAPIAEFGPNPWAPQEKPRPCGKGWKPTPFSITQEPVIANPCARVDEPGHSRLDTVGDMTVFRRRVDEPWAFGPIGSPYSSVSKGKARA